MTQNSRALIMRTPTKRNQPVYGNSQLVFPKPFWTLQYHLIETTRPLGYRNYHLVETIKLSYSGLLLRNLN